MAKRKRTGQPGSQRRDDHQLLKQTPAFLVGGRELIATGRQSPDAQRNARIDDVHLVGVRVPAAYRQLVLDHQDRLRDVYRIDDPADTV